LSPETRQQIHNLKLQIIAIRPELCQIRLQKKQKKIGTQKLFANRMWRQGSYLARNSRSKAENRSSEKPDSALQAIHQGFESIL